MKRYISIKKLVESEGESIIFETYKDALDWVDKKSKEYGSKNVFYSSDEYKKIYPYIKKLYDIDKEQRRKKAEEIMKEVGINYGDKVEYTYISPYFTTENYTGIVFEKNGIPYVKYDKGLVDIKNRKSSMWHKGWKKIK